MLPRPASNGIRKYPKDDKEATEKEGWVGFRLIVDPLVQLNCIPTGKTVMHMRKWS